jgi:hypothetical protein
MQLKTSKKSLRTENMKTFIGGLFKKRDDVEKARDAMREVDFLDGSINMLQCTHEKEAVMVNNPSIQSIASGALIGSLILGTIGGFMGLLVGFNIIHIPSLDSASAQALPFQITTEYIFTSLVTGLIFGAITGAILGVAARLASAPYRRVDTSRVSKGDLMLAVQVNDEAQKSKARSIMKTNGVVRFEEFNDKWDPEIWSVFDEKTPQVL